MVYAHKFEIYSGQENLEKVPGEPDLGATGNVVVRLLRGVPRMINHIIYFDNFYTSLPLVYFLAKQGIHTVGTVQQNRIPNNKLPDRKTFMKKSVPRGSYEERVSTFDGVDMSCVAWKDNKVVTLLSTYSGALPVTEVSRYDKAKKETIGITCPFIVQEYNKHMGVINAWVIYRKNAMERNHHKNNLLTMSQFRNELAFVLCNKGTSKETKRGRRSTSTLEDELQSKIKKASPAPPPPKDIRTDGAEHWPTVGGSHRCKYPKCKG
ncbi:hypothetical protein AVEN_104711-1 [Araneus ventricosus]|uniref:PiggyBac transposable element-derived protein domain-containing protein n=1 Tax=Araneus ventricosus TaxID=182803 RepID=A0A4Y2STX5_ARAVE|nr:hypothetical protein AVEN_99142-1 [Araneus ventricosus]GBN90639.1 hypothetical protein AVEN_104711-1 [Araneus ventricosus]